MVLTHSSPIGGGGMRTHPRDAGQGHDTPVQVSLVQRGGFSAQKGWGPAVLHRLPPTE